MDDLQEKSITRYLFADLILDVQRGELYRDGKAISLPKLSYDLLVALVDSSPSLMSQDELIKIVWPKIVVSDETLKQRVKILRKSIGDNASDPTYIEAVRGRGYRLIPEVRSECLVARPSEVMSGVEADILDANLRLQTLAGARPGSIKFRLTMMLIVALIVTVIAYVNQATHTPINNESVETVLTAKDIKRNLSIELYRKGQEYYKRYRKIDNAIAIDFYLKAIANDPEFSLAYSGLSQAYSQKIFQFDGVEENKNLAIENAYQALVYDSQSAESYKALGTAYYVSGWYSKSIDAYLKALNLSSKNIDTLSNLGFIYFEQGKLTQAVKRIKQALTLDPNHVGSMIHAGQAFQSLGNYPLAEKWYLQAIANQPDYIVAIFNLGQLYIEQGKHQQAKALFEDALKTYPEYSLLMEGLADCYFFTNQFEKAQHLYSEVKQSLPENDLNRASIMAVLLSKTTTKDDVFKLIEQYQLELETGSENASYSFSLAMLYAHLEQKEMSLRYLVQAVELGFLLRYKIENNPMFSSIKKLTAYDKIIANLKLKQKIHAKQLGSSIIFTKQPLI